MYGKTTSPLYYPVSEISTWKYPSFLHLIWRTFVLWLMGLLVRDCDITAFHNRLSLLPLVVMDLRKLSGYPFGIMRT